jgi:hypothetical protein
MKFFVKTLILTVCAIAGSALAHIYPGYEWTIGWVSACVALFLSDLIHGRPL